MSKKQNDNMKLWDSVSETNPAITKRVNQRGGFTAIDAQAQIKRASELWGPFGCKWGLRDLKFNELYTSEGIVGITLVAMFYYPQEYKTETIQLSEANFPIASDMPYKPNDDCFKKLQTDCITKALSRLGYNSDVFEGRYDDSKYVAEMEKKYNEQKLDKPIAKAVSKPPKPTVAEEGILHRVYEKYVEACPQKYVVNKKKLKDIIWNNFNKWPTKEESIQKIIEAIPIENASFIELNNFVQGID